MNLLSPSFVAPKDLNVTVLIFFSVENDMFGEFGEFDLVGSGFGGGMEDIEVARDARVDALEGETTDRTGIQVSVSCCCFFGSLVLF